MGKGWVLVMGLYSLGGWVVFCAFLHCSLFFFVFLFLVERDHNHYDADYWAFLKNNDFFLLRLRWN